jgi:hypothetical protein
VVGAKIGDIGKAEEGLDGVWVAVTEGKSVDSREVGASIGEEEGKSDGLGVGANMIVALVGFTAIGAKERTAVGAAEGTSEGILVVGETERILVGKAPLGYELGSWVVSVGTLVGTLDTKTREKKNIISQIWFTYAPKYIEKRCLRTNNE